MLLTLFATQSLAQTDDQIDQVRQALLADFDPQKLGVGYAAMMSFAVSPDITTATFYLDESGGVVDPTLNVIRVPYRHVFDADGVGVRPFVQGLFAYQTLESGFDIAPGEFVDSRWKTYGLAASGGVEIPVSEHLVLLPAMSIGYGRLENRAAYSGDLAENVLQPAVAGVLFDWDSNATVYGLSFGVDYKRTVREFDLEVLASVTHHQVKSTNSTSQFIDFDGHVTAFDIEVNSVHPTNWKLGSNPLALVALLGNTTFLGPERDALGFESFFEAGLALDIDVSSKGWKVRSLRFGAKAIFGSDVKGWSLIFGYGL